MKEDNSEHLFMEPDDYYKNHGLYVGDEIKTHNIDKEVKELGKWWIKYNGNPIEQLKMLLENK